MKGAEKKLLDNFLTLILSIHDEKSGLLNTNKKLQKFSKKRLYKSCLKIPALCTFQKNCPDLQSCYSFHSSVFK